MTVVSLIYFILICYGISTIIVQSKLFKPLRELVKVKSRFLSSLINCMMCTGFWVGLLVSLVIGFSPSEILYTNYVNPNIPNIISTIIFGIFDAAFVSGIVYHIYIIELLVESKLPNEQ